jgi:hypothetical protein
MTTECFAIGAGKSLDFFGLRMAATTLSISGGLSRTRWMKCGNEKYKTGNLIK